MAFRNTLCNFYKLIKNVGGDAFWNDFISYQYNKNFQTQLMIKMKNDWIKM